MDSINDLEFTKFKESVDVPGVKAVAVVNPDGSTISGGTSTGSAAYSDSGGTDKKGLVDADRHVQVDVLTAPAVTVDTTGLATETKQDTGNTSLASIKTNTDKIPSLGQALAAASVPVVLTAAQIATLTPPAAITNFANETGGNLATIAGKDFATQTTLSAINTKLVSGTDIGDVTINNSTGANAVNIQDGGNTITVDGTVTANTGLSQPLTDTQLRATAVPISVATIPSHNVTNAGTFAVQATLGAETTKVIGTVNIAASQTIAVTNATASNLKVELGASTASIGKLASNSGVDIGDVDILSLPATAPTLAAQQPPATTATVYNVTLTNANTEYSQALPANTKEFRFTCRTAFDVRYAFATGKVATPTAPYLTLKSGDQYFADSLNTSATLYLASAQAGVVVEMEVWS